MNTQVIAVSQVWLIEHAVSLLIAIIVVAVGWYLAGFLSRQVTQLLPRTGRVDQTVTPLISQLVRYAVMLITIIIALSQFGVQTASILAVLGAAGLAIALALQGTLSNLAAGIMLLWLRPFNVRDSIQTPDVSGTVLEIGLFGTRILTYDGLHVFAPNSKIWNATVTNFSRQPRRMVEIKFSIDYRVDFNAAKAQLLELAQDPRVLADHQPFVFIDSFGDFGVMIGLRVWCAQSDWWNLKCDLLARVKEQFDAANLALAYRRHDVAQVLAPLPADDGQELERQRGATAAAAAVSQVNGADRQ